MTRFFRQVFRNIAILVLSLAVNLGFANPDWDYIDGMIQNGLAGHYGTQGVATDLNQPSARINMTHWTGSDGRYYIYGGVGFNNSEHLTMLGDFWAYDPAIDRWVWLDGLNRNDTLPEYGTLGIGSPDIDPGSRKESMAWATGDGKLYLFGGVGYTTDTATGLFGTLWSYDTASNEWTWLGGSKLPNSPGSNGEIGIEHPDNWPSARRNAATWVGQDGHLYMFGGYRASMGSGNDLWRYNTANGRWTWLKGSVGPELVFPVYGEQGTAHPLNTPGAGYAFNTWTTPSGTMIMFGGKIQAPFVSDSFLSNLIWEYDPDSNQWTWLGGIQAPEDVRVRINGDLGVYGELGVAAEGNMPGGRVRAQCWYHENQLFMYGGAGFSEVEPHGRLSDLWSFDLASGLWTWLGGSQELVAVPILEGDGVFPGGRAGSAIFATSDTVTMFAGNTVTQRQFMLPGNDIWALDKGTLTWSHEGDFHFPWQYSEPDNRPGSLADAAAVSNPDEGAVYIFGGFGLGNSGGTGLLMDVWKFEELNGWEHLAGNYEINQAGVYTTESLSAIGPGGRQGTGSGMTHDGKLYIYGGKGIGEQVYPGLLNDLWTFDPVSLEWELLAGSGNHSIATTLEEQMPSLPASRQDMATWWMEDGSMYLFGGYALVRVEWDFQSVQRAAFSQNDFWRFDSETQDWTLMSGFADRRTTSSYGMVGIPDASNHPGPRHRAAHWVDREGNLYLFGGLGSGDEYFPPEGSQTIEIIGELSDFWRYSPASGLWTWLGGSTTIDDFLLASAPNTGSPWPTPRDDPGFWVGSDGLFYLYGGWGHSAAGAVGLLSDLWSYDPAAGTWTQLMETTVDLSIQCSEWGIMQPGGRTSTQFAPLGSKTMVYGGYGIDCNGAARRLDDVWLLVSENDALFWRAYR